MKETLKVVPKFNLTRIGRTFVSSAHREHLLDGLRKAGYLSVSLPNAPRLSIFVLPFDNLSDDPEQGYLADGITEDLITDLSRIRGMFVIARGTSFTFKGKAADPKKVAKDLNVRYVLEGSVRRSGDQVRVNAQLIDGATGAHVWSDRFDRELKNLFSLQNDVTGRIASTLKWELLEAESRRLRKGPPGNMEAHDYALRGWAQLSTNRTSKENALEGKRLLERALELDPNSGLAWIGMARIYMNAATSRWGITKTRAEALKLMLHAGQRAVALNPKNSDAYFYLSYAYRFNHQTEKAITACETAIDLNPNDDHAYTCLGIALVTAGRFAEALPKLQKSFRLNPRTPQISARYFILGQAYLGVGAYDKAVAALKKGVAANPKFPPQHWVLASALGWLGRKEEAQNVLADFNRIDKGRRDTIAKMRKRYSYFRKFDHVLEGLRRVGMPEK